MKLGDLVRLKRHGRSMIKDDWEATGLIVQVTDGCVGRKNVSYEVLGGCDSLSLPKWHTEQTWEIAK